MAITPLPPVPQRTDAPAVFVPKADTFLGALPLFQSEANAVQVDVNNNQVIASAAAVTATTQANNASASAALAQSSANATLWVSGTTYALGATVISPINLQGYRRKIAGAGTTDPSLDSTNWVLATPTLRFSSATASTVLTASTIGYVSTAMTVVGQSITLPDATTLTPSPNIAVVDNIKGGYPVGIRDNAGVLIGAVGIGGEAFITLKDRTTPNGIWSVTGTNLEPGLVTIDKLLGTNLVSAIQYIALDNNTSIHFISPTTSAGFSAFIVDNTGKVVSTPVSITVTPNMLPRQAFKVSNTQAVVFFSDGTTCNVVVLSISGSSPTLTLNVGTVFADTTNRFKSEDSQGIPQIAQLSPTLYVSASCPGSTTIGCSSYLVNTGTNTVTGGGTGAIASIETSVSPNTGYVLPLTATTAIAFYSNAATAAKAVIISVSGTTCSIGSIATIANNTATDFSAVVVSPTKVICANDNGGTNTVLATALIISSGTVITPQTSATVESSASSDGTVTSTVNRLTPKLSVISTGATNLVSFYYFNSNGISKIAVLSETAGTITRPAPLLYGTLSIGTVGNAGNGLVLPQGSGDICSVQGIFGATTGSPLSLTCSNTGASTTPTSGSGKAIRNYCVASQLNGNVCATKLSSGDYILTPTPNAIANILPVFKSNGDYINYKGEISIASMTSGRTGNVTFNTGVSSNRLVVLGNNPGAAVAPSASLQVRILNVEITA